MDRHVPVIAIDGPSASGKGTVAQKVAQHLHFHYLDSGALYRLVGEAARYAHVSTSDEPQVARLAETLNARFDNDNIYLNQKNVTDAIRSEAAGKAASEVAALPLVRQALLLRQRGFRTKPGLVADGRDMGSVVFPDAMLKIYLTADPAARAARRYKQLIGKGMSANMAALLQDIKARDDRDSGRAIAPLHKSSDAILLDTTNLSIDDAVEQVLARYAAATQVP
ncbi:MAG: cmk [Betaproteobacteria bacterium]|nr:cmk [Betaproteobacteria bacterium]